MAINNQTNWLQSPASLPHSMRPVMRRDLGLRLATPAFSLADTGGDSGLFSSHWLLSTTAPGLDDSKVGSNGAA